MTPEAAARQQIDRLLARCGWAVQDRVAMNIRAALGVAVREFPLASGAVDYLLYVDARAIGLVEAKPAGHPLSGVEAQSIRYAHALPADVPAHRASPLPFVYESTGAVTQFTNLLEPDARSREVFAFHRPDELLRLVGLDRQVRDRLRTMPPLGASGLWEVQRQAIVALEHSLAGNRPRALIQMATGSGKTFTAVNFCYRLIKHAGARRIVFLVDRANLGRQALAEFQNFTSPETGRRFVDEYSVQLLTANAIAATSKVVITTIQRLYSMLKGEPDYDPANEEDSAFELAYDPGLGPMPVEYNPDYPIETFDFFVVDECHRSIYNVWRQVPDYFDAFLIGLTATPTLQTIGYFQNNLVMEYGHEQAIVDGVNVGFDLYRIRTRISERGGTLEADLQRFVPRRDRRTRAKRYEALADDLVYAPNQLDREVVSEDQIRTIVATFKQRLPEIFLGRSEVPKTLVFAKDDSHAEDITKALRIAFDKGNEFVQKITYRTTGRKPEELLASFRNAYLPRIAVTVDMIATGTDVKPLECLLFMRNVKSPSYFEQMKGRGVRVIDPDDLRRVTPDARHKTHFVIVDAVGLADQDRVLTDPLDREPSVPFERLLDQVAKGRIHPDLVSTLADRLNRLNRQLDDDERDQIQARAGGLSVRDLADRLRLSLDPDRQADRARAEFGLGPDQVPTPEQLARAAEQGMGEALLPFYEPQLRELLVNIRRQHEQIIDEINPDTVLFAGFDVGPLERAQVLVANFREFIAQNKDRLEAIQILYSRPRRENLQFKQVKALAKALKDRPLATDPAKLWDAFQLAEPQAVRGKGGKAVADLVALVRHALDPQEPLVPYADTVAERYAQWLAEREQAGVTFTPEQRRWLDAIRDHIAKSLEIKRDDFDLVPLVGYGGLGRAHELFGEGLDGMLEELNRRLAA